MLSYSIRRVVLLVPVLLRSFDPRLPAAFTSRPAIRSSRSSGCIRPPRPSRGFGSELGLDEPLPVQYLIWLNRMLHGDFGTSLYAHAPVTDLILQRFPTTLALTVAQHRRWR